MRPRVKICGITRVEDVRLAAALGADAIGVIFTPRSPRCVDAAQARAIRAALPPLTALVALLMDQDAAEVRTAIATARPDLLQFHGDETDDWCAQFGLPFFKTLPMATHTALTPRMASYSSAAGFVLDGHAPGEPGGQGKAFDWTSLPAIGRPWLLAGGLTPHNIAAALRAAHPWGVDVSSGVEQSPGIKDAARLQAFFDEIHRETAACRPDPR